MPAPKSKSHTTRLTVPPQMRDMWCELYDAMQNATGSATLEHLRFWDFAENLFPQIKTCRCVRPVFDQPAAPAIELDVLLKHKKKCIQPGTPAD